MAALVDTSIPEITRQLSEPADAEIEPDVVVKSKPMVSVLLEQEEEEEIEPDVVVKSKPRPVDVHHRDQGEPAVIEVSQTVAGYGSQADRVQQSETTAISSRPSESQTSQARQKKANGDIGLNKKVAPSQAVAESIEQAGVKKKKDEEFEDSTAMLLRRYTASKSGRQTNIPITSTGEIGGTVSLKETFRVAGKNCTVRLEEDYISWVVTGRKDGEFINISGMYM